MNVSFLLIIQKASILLTVCLQIKKGTQIESHTICATLRKEAKLLSWWSQLEKKSLHEESESWLKITQLKAITTKKECSPRFSQSVVSMCGLTRVRMTSTIMTLHKLKTTAFSIGCSSNISQIVESQTAHSCRSTRLRLLTDQLLWSLPTVMPQISRSESASLSELPMKYTIPTGSGCRQFCIWSFSVGLLSSILFSKKCPAKLRNIPKYWFWRRLYSFVYKYIA